MVPWYVRTRVQCIAMFNIEYGHTSGTGYLLLLVLLPHHGTRVRTRVQIQHYLKNNLKYKHSVLEYHHGTIWCGMVLLNEEYHMVP